MSISSSTWLMARQHFQQQKLIVNDDRDIDHDDGITTTSIAAPLYITIGPPCCGKTLWTRNKQKQQKQKNITKMKMTTKQDSKQQHNDENNNHDDDVIDVAIDDQDGVYWKIPYDIFMNISSSSYDINDNNYVNIYANNDNNYDSNDDSNDDRNDDSNDDSVDDSYYADELKQYSEQIIYYKTMKERILSPEQKELCTVLHYLFNVDYDYDTSSDFIGALLNLQDDKKHGLNLQHQILWEVFEEYVLDYRDNIKTPPIPPSTIDLFIREAIFTPSPPSPTKVNTTKYCTCSLSSIKTNTISRRGSGIERAINIMKYKIPLNQSIVWSNTNTRAVDYKMALQIAYEQKRPVHYVVYYDNDYDTIDNSVDENDEMILQQIKQRQNKLQVKQQLRRQQNQYQDILFDLNITFYNTLSMHSTKETHNFRNECYKELIRRNIKRFIETGRYIPCQVIYDMKIHSKQLIQNIMKELYNNNNDINNNNHTNNQHNNNDDRSRITNNNNKMISKVQFDCMLTQLNRYEMNINDHTVYPSL